MLPDFPDFKLEARKIVNERLRRSFYGEAALLSRLRRFMAQEGDSFTVCRADGTTETSRYRQTAAEFSISNQEIATLTPQALAAKLDKVAAEMAAKASRAMFEKLNQITSATGQVVHGQGRPLTWGIFLESFAKMDLEFDERGDLSGMTIVVPPDVWARLREKLPEWDADPEFKRRYGNLMATKREEWRDRESRRTLVD